MPRAKQRRGRFEASQPDNRRWNRWRDQHGRVWEGVMEIESGQPVGPLSLVEVKPPFLPEQKYFRFKLLDNAFTIDYASWIRDREYALQTYETRRRKYAQKLYGERAGAVLRDGSAELDREVGTRPQPIEPVLAAASGNRWILGLSDNKPSWAEKFFPENDPTALFDGTRNLTPEQLRDLRLRFPDASGDDDGDAEFVFDMDSISPEQRAWLDAAQAEEEALEATEEDAA